MNKLWLLTRERQDWDEANGFVVRALDETSARLFASGSAGDEGRDTWLDHERSKCVELLPEGQEGVVLCDFANG